MIQVKSKVIMHHKTWGFKIVKDKASTITIREPEYLFRLKFNKDRRNIYALVNYALSEGFEVVAVIDGYLTKRKLYNVFPELLV